MPQTKTERVLKGQGVSGGIAIAAGYVVELDHPRVPRTRLATDADVAAEKTRFRGAVDKARQELTDLKTRAARLPETAAEEAGLLLDAHLAMLAGSRLIRGVEAAIAASSCNAEAAIEDVMQTLTEQFRALKDHYIAARIDDVEAVAFRLIRILMDLPYMRLDAVPEGGIVLAREISPAESALLDPRLFGGIATVLGGSAGHTAVMARSLGLPAVLGVDPQLLQQTHHGDTVIIDGNAGVVILNPRPETLAQYRGRQSQWRQEFEGLKEWRDRPAATADGVTVTLRGNLELPRDVSALQTVGAQGVGLFRTEFLFMNRSTLPTEDEQYHAMKSVVDAMAGEQVTFRTLDIGGDKLAKSLGEYVSKGENPALGLRAIRLTLKHPQLLETQFRAMLRAGLHGPIRILLPMVTTATEVTAARKILKECHRSLKKDGIACMADLPPLGCMIEIPAAALSADSLAAVADFFALGTNDLVQYTVAIDRGNDMVASLYNPLNPAVLRLLEFSIEAGTRAGIPVSICGEMAADARYVPLLLGLGLREFSVGAANVLRVKRRIGGLPLDQAQEHARQVMNQYDPAEIIALVNAFAA